MPVRHRLLERPRRYVHVAATALIADSVPLVERGRAIGEVDSFAA